MPTSQLRSLASLLSWGMAVLTLWRLGATVEPPKKVVGPLARFQVADQAARPGPRWSLGAYCRCGFRGENMLSFWSAGWSGADNAHEELGDIAPTTTVNRRLLFGVLVGPTQANVAASTRLGSLVGRVLSA